MYTYRFNHSSGKEPTTIKALAFPAENYPEKLTDTALIIRQVKNLRRIVMVNCHGEAKNFCRNHPDHRFFYCIFRLSTSGLDGHTPLCSVRHDILKQNLEWEMSCRSVMVNCHGEERSDVTNQTIVRYSIILICNHPVRMFFIC